MENDCAFANLEDKYTFKFKEKQKGRSIGHYLRTHTYLLIFYAPFMPKGDVVIPIRHSDLLFPFD